MFVTLIRTNLRYWFTYRYYFTRVVGVECKTGRTTPESLHNWFDNKGHVQRCAVLCCAVLCCAVLCCAVLCCAVLCCAVITSNVCTLKLLPAFSCKY